MPRSPFPPIPSASSLALADDILFTTAPTLTGGGGAAGSQTLSILPYAIGRNTAGASTQWGLVTYDSNGIRALRTTEYSTLASAAGSTSNARDAITANTMSITGNTVNAYVLDNTLTTGVTPVVTLSGTLTPASGELVFAATSTKPSAITLTGGTIDFATAEGIIAGYQHSRDRDRQRDRQYRGQRRRSRWAVLARSP